MTRWVMGWMCGVLVGCGGVATTGQQAPAQGQAAEPLPAAAALPTGPATIMSFDDTTGVNRVAHLRARHGVAYWITVDGVLRHSSLHGGAPSILAEDLISQDMVVAGDFVFVAALPNSEGNDGESGRLVKVHRLFGSQETVATGQIHALAADDERVYWLEMEPGTNNSSMRSVAVAGGSEVSGVSEGAVALALGPDALFRAVYPDSGPQLFRHPKTTGQGELVATLDNSAAVQARSLVTDGDVLVWLDWSYRINMLGTDGSVMLPPAEPPRAEAFAVGNGAVYTATRFGSEIRSFAVGSQVSEPLLETDAAVQHLAVDGDNLFWAEWSEVCEEEHFDGKSGWCSRTRYTGRIGRLTL